MTLTDKLPKYDYSRGSKRAKKFGKIPEEYEQRDIKNLGKGRRLSMIGGLTPEQAQKRGKAKAIKRLKLPGSMKVIRFAQKLSSNTVRQRDINLVRTVKTSERKTVSAQIDYLYDVVAHVSVLLTATPNDSDLKSQLANSLSELRRLQNIEAEAIERRFHQSLRLPLGMGTKAIADADALIQRYENSATKDTAAE